ELKFISSMGVYLEVGAGIYWDTLKSGTSVKGTYLMLAVDNELGADYHITDNLGLTMFVECPIALNLRFPDMIPTEFMPGGGIKFNLYF
ncbi:MAG: hypothetical protein JW969_03300, partial [Spirochaetales bacterium]|nr:hypothetical protein [Spirochaetales bacterium]